MPRVGEISTQRQWTQRLPSSCQGKCMLCGSVVTGSGALFMAHRLFAMRLMA